MSDIEGVKDVGGWILYFVFYSTVILNLAIFIFVAFYDYAFIPIYDFAASLDAQGLLQEGFLALIDFVIEYSKIILQYFDMFWFFGFLAMAITLFVASYHLRRPNHFSLLFLILYGFMGMLFILSIILQITGWWNLVFLDGVLANVSVDLPFYNLYLNNVGIINGIVFMICVILNMVDFDLITFGIRKQEDRIRFDGNNGSGEI